MRHLALRPSAQCCSILLLLCAAVSSLGAGSPSEPSRFPVGLWPSFVVVGDFDGDGHPDLAAANRASADLSVLLGRGDGSFLPQVRFRTGWEPVAVATGDFNGDGHLDLATANRQSGDVSILMGLGDGGFAPERRFPSGGSPLSLAAGDFNSDGRPDLIVLNESASTLSLLPGRGDGTFDPGIPVGRFMFPEAFTTGDFNADGRIDLAVADYLAVRVLPGRGDGTFDPAIRLEAEDGCRSLVTGDFNGDARPDLAAVYISSKDALIFLGAGDGTFTRAGAFPAGRNPVAAAVGDFDGDGRLDLAVADPYASPFAILPGFGNGAFGQPRPMGDGGDSSSLAAGDFDSDGHADLAVADFLAGDVSVFRGPFTLPDRPPVASAGPDLLAQCTSPAGAALELDGSASSDPDSSPRTNNDIVSFEWIEDYGDSSQRLLGTGEVLDVTLPIGRHFITLRVTDRTGLQGTDEMEATVFPPPFSVIPSPSLLWPPNHRMVDVRIRIDASNVCGPFPVLLDSVLSSEPDDAPGGGDGSTTNDIQGAEPGTPDLEFQLRAERESNGEGRTYCIVYGAADARGIFDRIESLVRVPRDSGRVVTGIIVGYPPPRSPCSHAPPLAPRSRPSPSGPEKRP